MEMQKGDYPKLQVSGKDLPFSDADVGKRFEIVGTVLLDSLIAEGPAFNFEVLELDFPEKQDDDRGELRRLKKIKNRRAGVKITIES